MPRRASVWPRPRPRPRRCSPRRSTRAAPRRSTTIVAQRYLEALTAFAASPNQKTLVLPIEATGVLGSLAGIGEIAARGLRAIGCRDPARGRPERSMSFEPWHWLLLGGALIVIEALAPGFVALWLGIAAVLTGGVAWLLPSLGWQAQILVFAVLAVAAIYGWLAWRRRFPQRDRPAVAQPAGGRSRGRAAAARRADPPGPGPGAGRRHHLGGARSRSAGRQRRPRHRRRGRRPGGRARGRPRPA